MKKESIITLPNPDLREKSARVHVITDDVLQLIDNMTSASLDWEDSRPHEISAALAAVQIDQLERVVIVRSDFEDKSVREFTPLSTQKSSKVKARWSKIMKAASASTDSMAKSNATAKSASKP